MAREKASTPARERPAARAEAAGNIVTGKLERKRASRVALAATCWPTSRPAGHDRGQHGGVRQRHRRPNRPGRGQRLCHRVTSGTAVRPALEGAEPAGILDQPHRPGGKGERPTRSPEPAAPHSGASCSTRLKPPKA